MFDRSMAVSSKPPQSSISAPLCLQGCWATQRRWGVEVGCEEALPHDPCHDRLFCQAKLRRLETPDA